MAVTPLVLLRVCDNEFSVNSQYKDNAMPELPTNIQKHHIGTQRAPTGYVATFRFFDSPSYHALARAFEKRGLWLRSMACDGAQTTVTIVYEAEEA